MLRNVAILSERNVSLHLPPPHSAILQVLQDGRNGPRITPCFSLSFGVCLLFVLLKLTNHTNNLVAF